MAKLQATEFELVEPRFVSIRPRGRLVVDEATVLMELVTNAVGHEPFFLFEVFMADVDGADPEARRAIAQGLRALPDRAIAFIGCSFSQKILAKLVVTAVSMMGQSGNSIAFFDEQERARQWLRDYAAKAQAKQGK